MLCPYEAGARARFSLPGAFRQEPLEAPADRVIAFACRFLEPGAIGNSDGSTALADQTDPLKRARDAAHRRALNPEHLGQDFVGEGDVVLVGSVAGAQDGAAAPGFHAVNRIAGDGLERLSQKGLRISEQHTADLGPLVDGLAQAVQNNTRCRAGNLGDVTPEGLASNQRTHEAEHGFPAEHRHFDRATILQNGDQGNDGIMGEVSVPDRLVGLVDDLAPRQIHQLEMRFEP